MRSNGQVTEGGGSGGGFMSRLFSVSQQSTILEESEGKENKERSLSLPLEIDTKSESSE